MSYQSNRGNKMNCPLTKVERWVTLFLLVTVMLAFIFTSGCAPQNSKRSDTLVLESIDRCLAQSELCQVGIQVQIKSMKRLPPPPKQVYIPKGDSI